MRQTRYERDEPRRGRADDDDTRRGREDEDELEPPTRNRDDRQRPRKKKKKKKGGSGLVIGLTVGAFIFLGIGALVLVLLLRGDKEAGQKSADKDGAKDTVEPAEARLLGKWKHESDAYFWEFKANGTLVIEPTAGPSTSVSYKVNGALLEVTYSASGKPSQYKVELKGDELSLHPPAEPKLHEINSRGGIDVAVGEGIQAFRRVKK